MPGKILTLKGVYKTTEIIVVLAGLSWLMYPVPYSWEELGEMYPGLQYGAVTPALIYLAMTLRVKWKARKAEREAAASRPAK